MMMGNRLIDSLSSIVPSATTYILHEFRQKSYGVMMQEH